MRRAPVIALAFCAFAFLAAPSPSFAACPEGNYAVKGWNPGVPTTGNVSYRGTVTVKSVGEVCQLNWKIGSQIFGGVGTYDAKVLNVGFKNLKDGTFGLVVYKDAGSALNGQWVIYGDKTGNLGTEILTKQ
jgi:hypothetical protein